jgi:hypothetical protein
VRLGRLGKGDRRKREGRKREGRKRQDGQNPNSADVLAEKEV